MKILHSQSPAFAVEFARLTDRTAFPAEVETGVREILQAVRNEGDAAVTRYAARFDAATFGAEGFRLTRAEIDAAWRALPAADLAALRLAHEHIQQFSRQRMPRDWQFEPRPGVTLGERFVPLSRVAAYVPGGSAPLASTVLHTVTMAAVAGVADIAVLSPPTWHGSIHPAIIVAADLAGADEILRLGGVYAIAAAAFGTQTIRRADKIVGPGNAWVTAAKRLVYGHCALDLVAGPSEVLVLADSTGNARFIAADLLAQAEHGSGHEQAVLVTTCPALIPAVEAELTRQAALLSRSACIRQVLENGIFLIEASDDDEAISLANAYAAEHLEVHMADPRAVARRITAAGAIFLGPYTPEPVGDFVAGPSHVLPTGGAARYFSGLTVEQFCRRMSLVEYSADALAAEQTALAAFARMEQLDGHGRSVSIRFDEA